MDRCRKFKCSNSNWIFFFSVLVVFFLGFQTKAQSEDVRLNNSGVTKKSPQKKSYSKTQKRLNEIIKTEQSPVENQPKEIITSIEVRGNKKIEKDSILNRIKSKPGQNLSSEIIREDILTLFKTQFFSDIQVLNDTDSQGLKLIFVVKEKPSIGEIVFEGMAEIKQDEVADAAGLKAYEIYNPQKIKDAQDKIQKFYEDKGFFLAKIESQVVDLEKDQSVKVTFSITENEKVKVKKITFLGNKNVSEAVLKDRIMTKEQGFFHGMSGSGAYKQEIFQRDVQILSYLYSTMGYVRVQIDRPQVYVTPDRKGIYITMRIDEGEKYSVGEIDFAGDLLFEKSELFDLLQLSKSEVFSIELLQKDLSSIQAKYGDLGYAYANIEPKTRFLDSEKKVDLVFDIQRGDKVYFGQINVIGNSKTRDKVVRRELKVKEGELYNETRRRESQENIQRLGFFDEVSFRTSTPDGEPDKMNIDIVVKERNTGQIQAGAGWGTSQGFNIQGSVQQSNFYGHGQNLAASINYSNKLSVYDISFTEPYFKDTLWSVGGRVFRSQSSGRSFYDEMRSGASVTLGHPIGDLFRASLTYGYTKIDLTGKDDLDEDLFPLSTAAGDAGTLSGALEYDSRNDRFKPTKGHYARLGYAYTGLGGNLRYYKGNADYRYFKNIFWDVVWRNSFQYAKIDSLDSGGQVPFNELYLLGGPYTLRGFRLFQVGRMKQSQKLLAKYQADSRTAANAQELSTTFFGGEQQFLYQTELLFPLIKEADMYGVMFYDVGQAEDQLTSHGFASDLGFGIRWFSPLGPLRFEWGFPIEKYSKFYNKENMVFEFSIGTPF